VFGFCAVGDPGEVGLAQKEGMETVDGLGTLVFLDGLCQAVGKGGYAAVLGGDGQIETGREKREKRVKGIRKNNEETQSLKFLT
jgi:hypothetical protein